MFENDRSKKKRHNTKVSPNMSLPRNVEMLERDYLRENGVVTELQCDLGLTALKASEVMDLMAVDYVDK